MKIMPAVLFAAVAASALGALVAWSAPAFDGTVATLSAPGLDVRVSCADMKKVRARMAVWQSLAAKAAQSDDTCSQKHSGPCFAEYLIFASMAQAGASLDSAISENCPTA